MFRFQLSSTTILYEIRSLQSSADSYLQLNNLPRIPHPSCIELIPIAFNMVNHFSISNKNEPQYITLTEALMRYPELQGESKTWLDALGKRNYGHPASALYKTDFVIEQQRRFGRRKLHDLFLVAVARGELKGMGGSAVAKVSNVHGEGSWRCEGGVGEGVAMVLLVIGGVWCCLFRR